MKFHIEAACGCSRGKIRSNNEDNFYFDGKCLEVKNDGLKNTAVMEERLKGGLCFAVFDGVGGEDFGEEAAFAAARGMQRSRRSPGDYFASEQKYLNKLALQLNDAVVARSKELLTSHMGCTMAALYFAPRYVYVCNLGDSRAYRLRDGELMQLTKEHVSSRPMKPGRKPPITQFLGIDPEEMLIEPYIAGAELKSGDRYLICSDGLTDMVTNFEIADIMLNTPDCARCVEKLIAAAMENGGRDNITVIVCTAV